MRTVLDSYCPLEGNSEDEVRKPPAPGGPPGAAARVAGRRRTAVRTCACHGPATRPGRAGVVDRPLYDTCFRRPRRRHTGTNKR